MHWLQSFWLYFSFSLVGSSRRNSRIFSLFKWVDCGVVFEGAKKPPPVIGSESKQVLCTHTAWGRWSRCFWILSSDNSHLIWFHFMSFHPIRSRQIWHNLISKEVQAEEGWIWLAENRFVVLPACCRWSKFLPPAAVNAPNSTTSISIISSSNNNISSSTTRTVDWETWLGTSLWSWSVEFSPKKSCSSATFCPPSAVLRIKTPLNFSDCGLWIDKWEDRGRRVAMENLDTKTIEAQGRRPSLETIRLRSADDIYHIPYVYAFLSVFWSIYLKRFWRHN